MPKIIKNRNREIGIYHAKQQEELRKLLENFKTTPTRYHEEKPLQKTLNPQITVINQNSEYGTFSVKPDVGASPKSLLLITALLFSCRLADAASVKTEADSQYLQTSNPNPSTNYDYMSCMTSILQKPNDSKPKHKKSKPNPSATLSLQTIDNPRYGFGYEKMTSSQIMRLSEDDSAKYHVKPTHGDVAMQNEDFMRKIGLNKMVPQLRIIIAKTKLDKDSEEFLFSLGHARPALPNGYQPILQSSKFMKKMKELKSKAKDEEEILEEILHEVIKDGHIVECAMLQTVGVDDVMDNPNNIFVNQEGEYAFPDLDGFSNPTLPDPDIIELFTEEDYKKLQNFILSPYYTDFASERLKLIKRKQESGNTDIYDIFERNFTEIRDIFAKFKGLEEYKAGTQNIKNPYLKDCPYGSVDVKWMGKENGAIKVILETTEDDHLLYGKKITLAKHPLSPFFTENPALLTEHLLTEKLSKSTAKNPQQ